MDNIPAWDEKRIMNLSISSFQQYIAQSIAEKFGIDSAQLLAAVQHGSPEDGKVRKWAKYAMGAKKTPGTPYSFVNGVAVDNGTNLNVDEWKALIKSLV